MRVVDRLFAVLLHPRVRRVRRWSSLVTLPLAAVLLARGQVATGAAVLAVRAALLAAVAVLAWRLQGERAEALRDLLMHPRARAFLRAEADVVLTLPRLALRRRPAPRALRYERRGDAVAVAAACTPAVLAEAVPVYLLVPPGWVVVHALSVALHAYALVWLWAWALGPRAWPHAVRDGVLTVRSGPLQRARVPLGAIVEVHARRRRVLGAGGLRVEGDTALLPAGGRVDVLLELSEPVRVEHPLGEPVLVRRLALASDEAGGFRDALASASADGAVGARERRGLLALALDPLAVLEATRA